MSDKPEDTPKDKSPLSADAPHPIDAAVESWWDEHVRGSVVGRSTEIWNHLQEAKEVLKVRLKAL